MKSRVVRVVGILLLLLVVLIFLLPAILSSGPVRGLVLGKAAAAAPGEVAIGDWAFTWNSGLRMERLSYKDAAAGAEVTVEQVSVQKGLLGLLRDHRDLGEIRVQGPVVRLVIPEASAKGAAGEPASALTPGDLTTPSEAPAKGPAAGPIRLPDYALDFGLDGGRIEIVAPGQTATQVIENLSVRLAMAGATQPVTYEVNCRVAGGEGGLVGVRGSTTLSSDGLLQIDRIVTDTDVAIEGIDLAPWTTWAAARGLAPVVHGRLSATLKAGGSLADGIRVRGNVQVPQAGLSGDLLQGDEPLLGDITLVINAAYAGDRLGISNLVFRSGVAAFQATGELGASADGTVTVDGQIDLAALARELPKTLRLQEGVSLDEGVVKLAGKVGRAQGVTTGDLSVSIDALRGRRGDEPIAWDAPTRVLIRGRQGPDLLVLDSCEITSPFLKGTGAGTLDDMTLHVDASLDRAIEETGKFVDLAGWSASGEVTLDLSLRSTEASRTLTCALASPQVSVARGEAAIAPQAPMRVDVSAEVVPPDGTGAQYIQNPVAKWRTWLSTGQVAAARIDLPTDNAPPALQRLSVAGTLDLDALAVTLGAMESLPDGVRLGGAAEFEADADGNPRQIDLSALTVHLRNLVAGNADGVIRDDEVTLSANGVIEPESQSLRFPAIACDIGAGSIRLTDTSVAGSRVSTKAKGQVDVQRLLAMVGDFVKLPEGTSVTGTGSFDAGVDINETRVGLTAHAALSGLEIRTAGGEVIKEDRVGVNGTVAMDNEAGTLSIRDAAIESDAVQLNAAVDQKREGDQHELSSSGDLGLDLARLAAYARALLGMEIQMAGKQSQPFTFASTWQDEEPNGLLRHATMSAALHADQIQAFGLNVSDLNIPLQIEDGKANLNISGQVNEGQLKVLPVIDFNTEPAVASLTDPTNLLTNVQLTDQLSTELLAKIHPLFKGASDVTGQLSLGMDEFVWPLSAEARPQARFNGWMQFTGLKMQTHGLVEKILTAMKVRERSAEFGDRRMEFRCENDRITCSPLRFEVDGHDVSIVGSMGLDQTLDYSAQIPVTESLVGRDSYKYLEGTSIRVPIRGTASQPDLHANVLAEATGDLVKQAAQKAIKENAGKLLEGLFNK